jgi:hypothetical protein
MSAFTKLPLLLLTAIAATAATTTTAASGSYRNFPYVHQQTAPAETFLLKIQ